MEELWGRFESVEWRHAISEEFADVYGELAWCQAKLGEEIRDILRSATHSKAREFVAHVWEVRRGMQGGAEVSEYLDQLRIEQRVAEIRRWHAQRGVTGANASASGTIETVADVVSEVQSKRRLLLGDAKKVVGDDMSGLVSSYVTANPRDVLCDVTVTRWGTVVVVARSGKGGNGPSIRVHMLPFNRRKLIGLVAPWSDSYLGYTTADPGRRKGARRRWAEETAELVEHLGVEVIRPIFGAAEELPEEGRLILVPGLLAGTPLHAATVSPGADRCVAESVEGFAYALSLAVMSPGLQDWRRPETALCILSDPGVDVSRQLPGAADEAAAVSDRLVRLGARVNCLSLVGDQVGEAAFRARGVMPPSGVTMLEGRPTPDRVRAEFPAYDYVFYSGHGVADEPGQSGLLLAGDTQQGAVFTEDQVLALPFLRRGPTVFLRACDTAQGGRGSSPEVFDFASGLLRVGARCVIGSLWVVVEDCAKQFSERFHSELIERPDPTRAFRISISALRALRRDGSTEATDRAIPPDHPIYWAPFIEIISS